MVEPQPVVQVPIAVGQELDLQERTTDFSGGVANTTQQVVPANKARTALWIVNDSSVVIYLQIGRDAAQNKGIRLNAAGGAFEINKNNLSRRAIHAIAATGSGNNLTILELESRYAYQ